VLWAGCYWQATRGGLAFRAPSPAARNTVSLRAPGASATPPVTAQTLDTERQPLSGFAEVTDQVRAAGVGPTRWANGAGRQGEDRYAAWD